MGGQEGNEEKGAEYRWNTEWRRGKRAKRKFGGKRENNHFSQHSKYIKWGHIRLGQRNYTPFSNFSPSHLLYPQNIAFQFYLPSRLELVNAGLWHEQTHLYPHSHRPMDTLWDWRCMQGHFAIWVPCRHGCALSVETGEKQHNVFSAPSALAGKDFNAKLGNMMEVEGTVEKASEVENGSIS